MSAVRTRQASHERTSSVPGLVLLLLACFVLAAALLLRFFIADHILGAPKDVYTTTRLQGVNATYFDTTTAQTHRGATLTMTSTIRGAPESATDGRAAWDAFVVTEDLAKRKQLDFNEYRMAFDQRTAELVNCCRATVKPAPGEPESYGLFFPAGIDKGVHYVYDPATNRAWPMRYEGTETIEGLEVYRFVQRIDPTNTGPVPAGVRSELLRLPGESRIVPAERWYDATITMWIEPRSGVLVDRRHQISSSIRGTDGLGELLTGDFDLRMVDEDRRKLAGDARSARAQEFWLNTVGPLACLVIGVALLAVALVLLLRSRHRPTLIDDPFWTS